mmetsp:Transcript_25394/g.36363  ORF Transcript_25394/g.36363 Transcript_25394/m.36363 type:complete len:446 (-) Transcript_25394:40-1377(-)
MKHFQNFYRMITNGSKWQQVSENVAFTQNADLISSPMLNHTVRAATNRMLPEQGMDFGNDSYQMAWRLLGTYVDCNTVETTENSNQGSAYTYGSTAWCSRQLLFAVYFNPQYKGGGIGEYTYYDSESQKYKCYGKGTCRTKMDCHSPNTEWKMLGVFKIDNINSDNGWMEQTFKHEGACLWGENTYEFASNIRKSIPERCEMITLDNKKILYYYTKPAKHGGITMGLYKDSMCSKEYTGYKNEFDVLQALHSNSEEKNRDFIGYNRESWDSFNDALDVYKQCQPCISHDLSKHYKTSDDEYGEAFTCYDKAGYYNCNQCGKFFEKSNAQAASKADLKLAAKQHGLVSFSVNGTYYGSGGIAQHPFTLPYLARGALVMFLIAFALVLKFGAKRRKRDALLFNDSADSFASQVNAKERFMNYFKMKKCNKKKATSVGRPNDYNIMII